MVRARRALTAVTVVSLVAVTLLYAWFIWQRRWIADDGWIYLRTARNIIEGNGPVFNAYERVESNTSALWVWILAGLGAVFGHFGWLMVITGALLSLAGFVIALYATRRFIRDRGIEAPIVPAGALVVIGAFPFWDYATSGLETSLAFAWLSLCWWLLVTLSSRRMLASAIVFGLGPLVRPELAIASLAFCLAAWAIERPPRRRVIALAAAALAVPLAYEIFRAGYYGTLVPLPALAKSASLAHWDRGYLYLVDYVRPCKLWLPGGLLVAVYAIGLRTLARRERIVVVTPLVIGVVLGLYVARVGGDFMHARLLLLPTFAVLLPAFVLPVTRITAPVNAALIGWAIWAAVTVGDGKSHVTPGASIEDERVGYVAYTHRSHPMQPADFIAAEQATPQVARATWFGERRVIWLGYSVPMDPRVPARFVSLAGRLGTAGLLAPLDAIVADTLGLAHPIGARIPPKRSLWPGHEKPLPFAWIVADFADPEHDEDRSSNVPAAQVRAARHAMECGEIAELLRSVREPMSVSRFWANITGAFGRTRLVIPSDPVQAEQRFCGNSSVPFVLASNEFPYDGWSKYNVVDGQRDSKALAFGHTSGGRPHQHAEWIELRFAKPRTVSKVVVYQATEGEGFPLDFELQVWNGGRWLTRASRSNFTPPGRAMPITLEWSPGDTTTRIRLLGTKLRFVNEAYVLQVGEIEI